MKHDPKRIAVHRGPDPLDAAIRDGVRRGRELHAAAVRAAFRSLVAGLATGLATALRRAAVRARSRRDLARRDARLLDDVGLDATAAKRESQKPFWQV